MHTHCCVPTCRSDSRRDGDHTSFHNIPRESELRQRWIINIRRDEGPLFKITKNTHVCSLHFVPDAFKKTLGRRKLNVGAVPTLFPWTQKKEPRRPKKRAYRDISTTTSECSTIKDDEDAAAGTKFHTPAPTTDHDYSDLPSSLEDQFAALKKHANNLEVNIDVMAHNKFCVGRFTDDPDLMQFYTGFRRYEEFISVFNALKPTAMNMIRWSQIQRQQNIGAGNTEMKRDSLRLETLPLIDQFFMFLCRVRQGFFEVDLSIRFNLSVSSVSRILLTWANYLYVMLGMLPCWPEKAVVNKLRPDCFRGIYSNIRAILDCTEIKVQSPSAKTRNSEMYSNYKSHSTMKGLIGITPDGMINFVSSLYTGSISDKEITRQSGILNLLEIGDDIMADKGFLIQDLLTPKGAQLVIPPFLKDKGKFTSAEVKETQEIARLRIHVERAIRRCKEYHIFDSVIPLTLAGSINQIWTVCCLLTNFYGKLY